jgi:CTP synthase
MQACVVEFARNVLGWQDANTTECNNATTHPVIDLMDEQKRITAKGATMRLGAYNCHIKKNSKSFHAYNNTDISERHRHRWEMNNKYLSDFENAGLMAVGTNPESGLVEIVELKKHPYFIGVQFHPELKSTVYGPHPLFIRFILAAKEHKQKPLTDSNTVKENVSVYS